MHSTTDDIVFLRYSESYKKLQYVKNLPNINVNYDVKKLENYYYEQAHMLARPSHTIYESRTETNVSIKSIFDLIYEMIYSCLLPVLFIRKYLTSHYNKSLFLIKKFFLIYLLNFLKQITAVLT